METLNFNLNGPTILMSFSKNGFTGFLMDDGRLETYMNDDLMWTSYSVFESSVEDEFVNTVNLISGELYEQRNVYFDLCFGVKITLAAIVFLAEDSGKGSNGIWVIQPNGHLYQFAENILNQGASEIAGLCFSPDNKWLFFNIQKEGLTIAITDPLEK